MSWSTSPLQINPPRPFCNKIFIRAFILPQTAFQPSMAVRPLCGSGSSVLYTFLIGVLLNIISSLLLATLSLWRAGYVIMLSISNRPACFIKHIQAHLLCFKGGGVKRHRILSYYLPRGFTGCHISSDLGVLPGGGFTPYRTEILGFSVRCLDHLSYEPISTRRRFSQVKSLI